MLAVHAGRFGYIALSAETDVDAANALGAVEWEVCAAHRQLCTRK